LHAIRALFTISQNVTENHCVHVAQAWQGGRDSTA